LLTKVDCKSNFDVTVAVIICSSAVIVKSGIVFSVFVWVTKPVCVCHQTKNRFLIGTLMSLDQDRSWIFKRLTLL